MFANNPSMISKKMYMGDFEMPQVDGVGNSTLYTYLHE